MPQAMNVSKFALSREDLLGPFAVQKKGAREDTEEFDDLGYVIVVFAVFRAGLGVEEVVACNQFEDLRK